MRDEINVPVLRISAELNMPEGCVSPDCGKLLSKLMKAVKREFPAVLSIERGQSINNGNSTAVNFGICLAAEVKHER